jgi:N-acetylglucosaminyldiphosphoundecaprenol N-acetyl-beta-D-mannosaminyltransferase
VSRVDVLGVPVEPVDLNRAVEVVNSWIDSKARQYVCLVNVHVVETAKKSPHLNEALRHSGLNLPDGAPVAWLVRRKNGTDGERVTGSDLFSALCGGSARRHFFLGSTPLTLEKLTKAVSRGYPTAEICGSYSPPFGLLSEKESEEIVFRINAAKPDIVWVGLGAPRQELWMLNNRPLLEAPALIGVGAVFDFVSGTKKRAPQWAQRSGLEWLHRLASEPRRLSRRYLGTNASFVIRVVRAGLRSFRDRKQRVPA